jgi:hypothetical protein
MTDVDDGALPQDHNDDDAVIDDDQSVAIAVDDDPDGDVNDALFTVGAVAVIGVQVDDGDPADDDGVDPWWTAAPSGGVSRTGGVALKLSNWAERRKVHGDPYVRGLKEALDHGSDLTTWVMIDPFDMLPEPEPTSGQFLERLARLITVLRNVAVFVPVAITWLAIQKATDAFGTYATDNPGESVNFLQFWQSGGEGGVYLSEKWRIQEVAFLDAMIVLGIVAATLVASVLHARGARRSNKQVRVLEDERTELALEITFALQPAKTVNPETLTEALAFALADLGSAARNVNDAAGRMERASVGVGALTPKVEDLTRNVEQLSARFEQGLSDSVERLAQSVSVLGVTLGGDMNTFLSDILAGLEEVTDRLNKTSVAVEFGTKQLRDDLDAMHDRLERLTNGRR